MALLDWIILWLMIIAAIIGGCLLVLALDWLAQRSMAKLKSRRGKS